MKKIILIVFALFFFYSSYGQKNKIPLYNPESDAKVELTSAIELANKENKNIFIQIGGNWCSWCYLFHDFCKNSPDISTVINENYISVKVNYSKENYNKALLAELGYPQRFGFPVFVILDKNGDLIHIQDSSLLEDGKGYNFEKVINFLKNWSPEALSPETYN